MIELSEEQKASVREWVETGESLSTIQGRINTEFGISLTYMEVRFLVDDLGAEFKEPEPEADASAGDEVEMEEAVLEPMDGEGGAVSVDVDKVMRPGAIVSGSVTFSDGVTAQWQLDQMGRLGIVPPKEGYQPPEADIEEFQVQLQQVLRKQGF